ncbi:hypothetical protein [Pseudonocardia nigra]|uniref:hypothetical protein n=1 Tax=Pseudonocardia nigra TaxID=1921578 RepID=UPI001C5FF891|nr:hypothetical protein [Pseudonocardia nigra]
MAALDRGRAGQAYNIVDDRPVGMDEFIDAVAAAVGAPRPPRIPGCLLRGTPYLHALMVGTRIRLDNGKAARELGWAPHHPTCHDGLAAVVSATRGRTGGRGTGHAARRSEDNPDR